MTVLDPSSGLLAFLIRFDSLEFNSLLASHIHCFGPPFVSFLRFSVPAEGLPLLEGLFKNHGDFTSRFRGGMFLGNILMELLYAVLISLKDSSIDSLSNGRLLERRGVVQDLIEAKFNLSFLLEYLRSLAHTLFQRKASRDLDAKIVVAEKALARAHKVLQDLKIKRQLILSSLTTSIVPPEGFLALYLSLFFCVFFFFRQFKMYKFFFFLTTSLYFCDAWILVILCVCVFFFFFWRN